MRICPFVSQVFGSSQPDESAAAGESPAKKKKASDKTDDEKATIVVLGYDEGAEEAPGAGGKPKATHLECIGETCRFYQDQTGDCQFDLIYSMLSTAPVKGTARSAGGPIPKTAFKDVSKDVTRDVSKTLSKDIDKIWKFQTRSFAELLASLGDSEKHHTKSLDVLKKDFDKKLDKITSKVDQGSTGDVKKQVESLDKKLVDGKKSMDELSGTMSQLVVNLHESINQLQSKSEKMFKDVDTLKESLPSGDKIKTLMDESIASKIDGIEFPDVESPLREFKRNVAQLLESHAESAPTIDFDALTNAQKNLESQVARWSDRIDGALHDLKTQQETWELRLDKLAERQADLGGYLEDGKKDRERARTDSARNEAKDYNNLGVTSFHNGAFEMAKQQFIQATEIDPEFAEAYNNLGLAYTELDDEKKASDAFKRAVELNPSLHAAYNNLGYIFFKQGNYDQAIEMYNEALGRSANNSSAYTNLGNAYYQLGRTDDAHKAWEKALEIDPGNEKARKNLQRVSEKV